MKKTIVKNGYALLTTTWTEGKAKDTYETIVWLDSAEAGCSSFEADPQGDTSEVYADGQCVYSQEENGGYSIKTTIIDAIDKVKEVWLGDKKHTKGTAEYAGSTKPYFAYLIIEETTDGKGKTTVYYNCQASRPKLSGSTSENGKFDFKQTEFEITARKRMSDNLVKAEFEGMELLDQVPLPTEGASAPLPTEGASA